MSYTGGAVHVFNMLLCSLLMDEVSQGRRDVQVLWSLLADLFVGEICK